MPALTSGKVLVTGASGYIGAWTVKYCLEAGFRTVGSVRTASKGDYLVQMFKDHAPRFSYVVVPDICAPDAFDEAVRQHQFDAVIHGASPFHFNSPDPEALIRPAVAGTISVLRAIQRFSPDSVKRVIILSSIAAIQDTTVRPPVTFTEKDWNHHSERVISEHGHHANAGEKYRASKALAEKAAWKFYNDVRPKWDMVSVNPALVMGPIIHECASPDQLNTSVKTFYDVMKNGWQQFPRPCGNGVDVRDVAEAQIAALRVSEASNRRFIVSLGPLCYQDFTDVLVARAPELTHIKTGEPGGAAKAAHPSTAFIFDGAQASKVLSVKYRSKETFIMDMYRSIVEREQSGWSNAAAAAAGVRANL